MKKYLLLGFGVCLLFLVSCKNDKDSFEPYPLDGKIENLIDSLVSESTSFVALPNTEHDFVINETSELKIKAPTFNYSGEGEIALNWKNAATAIEMELLKLPNYSNGKYLIPIYTFDVDVSQGEGGVDINNESPMELRIETDQVENVNLFFLSMEGWTALSNSGFQYGEWEDVNGFIKNGYILDIAHKGWYSLATKVDLASETFSSFCVELTGEYTQGNTKSFVVLDNDVVVPMARVMEQGTFCTTMNIPVGQPIKVIVMSSLRNGQYEMYYSEQIMENGLIVAPIMEERSIDEIKSILQDI